MHLLPKFAGKRADNDGLINRVHHAEFFELCAQVEDSSVDMVLADLPYGTTACSWDSIIPMEPMWREFKRIIKPRGAIVLTATEPFASHLRMGAIDLYKYDWVWNKVMVSNITNVAFAPLRQHENILVFSDGTTHYYPVLSSKVGKSFGRKSATQSKSISSHGLGTDYKRGVGYPKSIITMPRSNNLQGDEQLHPTQKPSKLFEYLIRTYTQPGDLVFDPCVGSGTTAIAAQNTGRNFICGDFTLEYVDIARRRLAGLPGKKPEPGVPRTIHMFAEYDPAAEGA